MKRKIILGIGLLLAGGVVAVSAQQDSAKTIGGEGCLAPVKAPQGGGGMCPGPLNVCTYDLTCGSGSVDQEASVIAAGHTPISLGGVTAGDLAGCDVLYAQNPDNGSFSAAWTGALADIDAAVMGGMTLIMHDRFVDDAEMAIPGLGTATCIRDFGDDANIDVADGTTSVTDGPGGTIDDTTLDGGNSSSHGYCSAATLPMGGTTINILSRTVTDESTLAIYSHGAGFVAYSSMPLDFYLSGAGNDPPATAYRDVYAPNVVQLGADAVCGLVPVELLGLELE